MVMMMMMIYEVGAREMAREEKRESLKGEGRS